MGNKWTRISICHGVIQRRPLYVNEKSAMWLFGGVDIP